jgi:hypothetical protein
MFAVDGWRPVKNLAKSMLGAEHEHAARVRPLLRDPAIGVSGNRRLQR